MDKQSNIHMFIQWGTNRTDVHAVLLTGSHANPNSPTDIFSDFDVVIIVEDIAPFFQDKQWIDDFGDVIVTYWDEPEPLSGYDLDQIRNVIQYQNNLHIDFTIWSIELMQEIVSRGTLPANFDDGYIRLLDKDGITQNLPSATYTLYIPEKPSEKTYLKVIEDFFSDVPYVAKCLWRDELLPAKWCLDSDMKHQFLLRMVEWWIEVQYNWAVPAGVLGRGLKQKLPSALWQKLEKTYVGADIEDNWHALFATIDLFREVSTQVGDALGYSYLHNMDKQCVAYAQMVRDTIKPKL